MLYVLASIVFLCHQWLRWPRTLRLIASPAWGAPLFYYFFPIGTQYRSAIFYLNEEQKKIAEDLIDTANKSGIFPAEIATVLQKFDGKFYKAEEYHQDYLEKNPGGYTCHRIREHWEF